MLGLRYFQASPTTYILQYKGGEVVREGAGLSFFYFAPGSTLVGVPLESVDVPFMFSEVSRDFQDVTVQGQVTYRVVDPKLLAGLMNFAVNPDGGHQSEAPLQLRMRVLNAAQVELRALLQTMTLRELLRGSDGIVQRVRDGLRAPDALPALGLDVVGFSILAVKPNPETARALEAPVREELLREADDATYLRRNAAIEQERAVRENELNTEIAVEAKKRQIREAQIEADGAVLAKRQEVDSQELTGDIAMAERSGELVNLQARNAAVEAEARAHAVAQVVKAVEGVDARVLQALMLGAQDPASVIAAAFQDLAANAERIGELNVGPDLLRDLMRHHAGSGASGEGDGPDRGPDRPGPAPKVRRKAP